MLITKINPIIINDNIIIEAEFFQESIEYPSKKKADIPYILTGKVVKFVIKTLDGKELVSTDCAINDNKATVAFNLSEIGEMKGEFQILDGGQIYTPVRIYFDCLSEVVK